MSQHKQVGLVWFRSDLRIVDNTALSEAAKRCDQLIGLYISTPMQWHEHHIAPMQVDLIRRRLPVLRDQLASIGIPFVFKEVSDFEQIPQVILDTVQDHGISHVFCNKQYEWNELQRDDKTGHRLAEQQIKFSAFDDCCVITPGKVLTKKGEAFKVFTPFRKEWLNLFRALSPSPLPIPEPLASPIKKFKQNDISVTYPLADSMGWPVEEETIRQRLVTFCYEKVEDYHQHRDIPSIDGTSCLSPYLALGMLSPRQCIAALLAVSPMCMDEPEGGAFSWLNEIIWREFYRHLLVAYPSLCRGQPFQQWTQNVKWQPSSELLSAWQHGLTGYPIVDAAMRQLKQTGWMHNRLRMITASFLTKDLLIHWQAGEQWFMSQLVDGDFASNNGGWQWAASTGTDAQPYFRVFNPTTQGERFDPKGEFIRTWLYELKDVPDKYIHKPHLWPESGKINYPKPIVDHKQARLLAISSFKVAKDEYNPLI
ncbi:deoxyribodipyrimidine photo-lyase [Photobacterium sp. ZSDE20]|uniref:Deoxyribodipyrimidine photo-lyase n=1 Tax=Photobacterium pectinilyticum TaxID=2906793 RepID=A0ABT1N2R2_9GAMM|nr:deoxyribodipyrimidine photo-lyase [Photobacterium sp. ZSDE20]MCQ1058832.1 deoxyribodipyrimidine photo-lyase [Photobacterium sp. ZSDE20]MDD1823878.1 deoxyribodipyrimidine photo-lyase [Photobacterium sp. ZSDE20]